jgi:hypothetical protein
MQINQPIFISVVVKVITGNEKMTTNVIFFLEQFCLLHMSEIMATVMGMKTLFCDRAGCLWESKL